MKIYKLRKDTALYPKGTIAEWCVNSHSYHIYDTDKRDSYMELMPWQIEENNNWELFEWLHKPLEGETNFISSEDQKEEGNLSKNSNSSKEPDHQALREESLKEMEDFETRDFHKTSFPPKRVTQVTFSIPQRYADAWRDLLDKKEE